MKRDVAGTKPLSQTDPNFSLESYNLIFLRGGHENGSVKLSTPLRPQAPPSILSLNSKTLDQNRRGSLPWRTGPRRVNSGNNGTKDFLGYGTVPRRLL